MGRSLTNTPRRLAEAVSKRSVSPGRVPVKGLVDGGARLGLKSQDRVKAEIDGLPVDSSRGRMVSARGLANLLMVSERHVWALNARMELPAPIRLGRSTRWSISELEAWQLAGCPPRDRWEQIKPQLRRSE